MAVVTVSPSATADHTRGNLPTEARPSTRRGARDTLGVVLESQPHGVRRHARLRQPIWGHVQGLCIRRALRQRQDAPWARMGRRAGVWLPRAALLCMRASIKGRRQGARGPARTGSRRPNLMNSAMHFSLHCYAHSCAMRNGTCNRCKACARSMQEPRRGYLAPSSLDSRIRSTEDWPSARAQNQG